MCEGVCLCICVYICGGKVCVYEGVCVYQGMCVHVYEGVCGCVWGVGVIIIVLFTQWMFKFSHMGVSSASWKGTHTGVWW